MRISRQQRRALKRSEVKHRVAESNARFRAARRVAARAAWRERHSLHLTTLQKLGLILELTFAGLGGPLVAIFYKGGWWLKLGPRKSDGT